jgi:hypothetical protein
MQVSLTCEYNVNHMINNALIFMEIVPFMKDIAAREFKLRILKSLSYLCMLRLHTPPSTTLSVDSSLLSFVCRLQTTLE